MRALLILSVLFAQADLSKPIGDELMTMPHAVYVSKSMVDCPAGSEAHVHDKGSLFLVDCEAKDEMVTMAVLQAAVTETQEIRDRQWDQAMRAVLKGRKQ